MVTQSIFAIVLVGFTLQYRQLNVHYMSGYPDRTVRQALEAVTYNDGKDRLNGLVTSNAGDELPGVLILPSWKGIDEEAKNAALALEEQGYVAFIADIYGEGNVPETIAEASRMAAYYKENHTLYQHRIRRALEAFSAYGVVGEKLAVIGYCFGGTGALECARGNLPVAGVVSIHGGLEKNAGRKNKAIHTKVLIVHPADDESVSEEDYCNLIQEMRDGKADWQVNTYGNSKHTFTNPKSPDYNEVMAQRAWKHTLMFLQEVLQ